MKKKVIAFYLPQYHCIPENDLWWGKGFTEWVNVKRAKPLFDGHNQPRVPLNNNYYSLTDKKSLQWQASLMEKYDIYGLCIYHYWFSGGKKLLEKPAEMIRNNNDIKMNYCFSWANENWTRTWDGGNNEVICRQDYGNETEWENHFQYLLAFFKDERYIKVDGKPMFLIYKPFLIPKLRKMVNYFNKRAIEEGFSGMYCGYQFAVNAGAKWRYDSIFDFSVMFEPFYTMQDKREKLSKRILDYLFTFVPPSIQEKIRASRNRKRNAALSFQSYDDLWIKIVNRSIKKRVEYPGAFVDWDNTARKKNGMVVQGTTTEKFKYYFGKLIQTYLTNKQIEFVFVNAWNEWGEGCYLEPDTKNGYLFLEGIKDCNK